MQVSFNRLFATLSFVAAGIVLATQSQADPLPGRDYLKFSQQPMIATTITNTAGVQATYKGHDELSTAYGFPNAANQITQYDGKFMADDFADKLTSPVVHVKWWGSYHSDFINPNTPVNKFLIAFETDVAPPVPGFSHPGQVLQADVVNRAPVISGAGSGEFTEKLIRGPDSILGESLYEYNAELHLNNAFFEQKDTVYWLKIAALIDVPQTVGIFNPYNPASSLVPVTEWGWHNRDYTIQDTYASPAVVPGETIVGAVDGAPVWHFQDDAVQGDLRYTTTGGIPNFGIVQPVANMQPTNYMANGIDGPSATIPGTVGIDFFSKDLAFNLYTTNPPNVPEPAACLLMAFGLAGLFATRRQSRTPRV